MVAVARMTHENDMTVGDEEDFDAIYDHLFEIYDRHLDEES